MGLREWNERVAENWSRNMDYMEISFRTPSSLTPEFMKSSKAPDTRTGFHTTGYATGLLTMLSIQALLRGQIGWGLVLCVLSMAPAAHHVRRGKKIQAQAGMSAPTAE